MAKKCNKEGCNNPVFSGGYCKWHAPRKGIKYNRKTTGELDMFKEIWEERAHCSEISGKPILQFDPGCFAHILSKGAYPKFRLNKDNIMILTRREHDLLDKDTEERRANYYANWAELYYRKEQLIKKYYECDR